MAFKKLLSMFTAAALTLSFFLGTVSASSEPVLESLPDDPMYGKVVASGTLDAEIRMSDDLITWSNFTPRALSSKEILRLGIDVSYYQGTIDWAQVRDSGVEFAFIRLGYRGYANPALFTDSQYQRNIEQALANGIQVGVYFFSQAITVEEAVEEADFVCNLIKKYKITLPVVFDPEYIYDPETGGSKGRLYDAQLSRTDMTSLYNAFIQEVEEHGYDGMGYANPNWLNHKLYRDGFDKLWLAHYTSKTSYSGDYDFWQCSSSGTIDGIKNRVDLDFWFDDSGSAPARVTLPFTDVSKFEWYYYSVYRAYELGLIRGISDTLYAPERDLTRGEFVTMLYRMFGEPAVSGSCPFTDLEQDYYRNAIIWASNKHFVNGISDTLFSPEDLISRQDIVTILYRVAESPKASADFSGIQDAGSAAPYALDALAWAYSNDIMRGVSEDSIAPWAAVTRAQIATFLMRFHRYMDAY